MKDTRLVELLKSFSPEEMSELEKFISSPFFSRNRDVVPLFKAIKNYYPEFESENFTKENIYHKLFPAKKFGDKKSDNLIRTLVSELLRLCKNFLAYMEFGKDENRKSYYMLNQLRIKKLYKEFDKEYKNSIADEADYKGDLIQTLMEKYLLASIYTNYSLNRDNFVEAFEATLKTRELTIVMALINSFKYEDEKILASGYNLEVRSNIVDSLMNHTNVDRVLEDMKTKNNIYYPYLLTLYFVHKMNKEKSGNEYYFKLKTHLEKNQHSFSKSDQYLFTSIMSTYCSVRNLFDELFSIYEQILKHSTYKISEEEDFHIVLFRNMVNVSSQLNKHDWLENFIHKYSPELHKDHRENMTHYSLAILNFGKNDFEKSLGYILKIKFDLFTYKLDTRMIQLKLYYELKYYEQALSLIDSSLHYIKNSSSIPERTRVSGGNFLKYTKELVRMKEKGINKDEFRYLMKRIGEEKNLVFKDWLKMKSEEMRVL